MNVAVLFGEVGFISRYKILEGIRERAEKDNANIVLYTCEGFLYQDIEGYIDGEYNIFNLPALEQYDGVIVDLDSIQNRTVAEQVKQNIEKTGIPCISFNCPIVNADVIRFDNIKGFRKLLDHLVSEHGATDIVYISGPVGNRDADERKELFLDVMHEHGIHIDDEEICYGNFNYASGREVLREYISSGKKLPQAFVCANDFMAIGLMDELKKEGIAVPEQVWITGYDNSNLARLTNPRLTTVDRGEYNAGLMAYDKLKGKMKQKLIGTVEQVSYLVSGKPVFGGSCGCADYRKHVLCDDSYVGMQVNMDGSLDLIKALSIEFSNLNSLDEFERCMEKNISKMGMDFFYFCQCGSRESYYNDLEIWAGGAQVNRDITKFQDTAWCPIAYEKGKWRSYSSFDIRNLFPPESHYKKDNSYYIVMPVHQGNICIGYSIIGNFREDFSGRIIQHLVLQIDEAIGNIRKQDIMRTMLAKIDRKWQYDELTGLCNRSGMRKQSEEMIQLANKHNMGIALMFFDLDGLKKINDSEGHDSGDAYIKAMGDALLKMKKDGDIAVRYGGDEYVFLSMQPSEEAGQKMAKEIQAGLKEPIRASVGFAFGYVKDAADLKGLIEQADARMYENKKERRAIRE